MQISAHLLAVVILTSLVIPGSAQHFKLSPKILSAKWVYFDDRSGVALVGKKASDQLRKWGRLRITQDKDKADLILLLSADPYKGGYIITAGGQTGTIRKNGSLATDPIPKYHKAAPVRYAYLTVIDPETGDNLWSESHQWGGLLTGFNSVGEYLIKQLEKAMKAP
ncbi:MAG TPA: hypothetical protein VFA76_08300 [Terriglobales bacterium]|nr:hypothetical protein [Terriglobales bacterium]